MPLLVIKKSPFIHYLSCTVFCFYRKSVQLFIICVNCIADRRIWEYNSSILLTAEVSMNREEYEISIEELKRTDKNTCTVIDIRDEISYNYGNIPNSVNIPLEKIKNAFIIFNFLKRNIYRVWNISVVIRNLISYINHRTSVFISSL